MKSNLSMIMGLCLGLSPVMHAQTPAKSPTPLQATVGEITDTRSTGPFFSECKVELKFIGDAAGDAATVHRVRLTEARDDLGRDLRPADPDKSSMHSMESRGSRNVLTKTVVLRNPSRNAASIKMLKGEAELFSPTAANGGILTIKDVLKHPAEPVKDPTLAKYKIELTYLTKESFEAKKKEAKDSGGGTVGAALGDMFQGMFGGMVSDEKNSIQVYVKDPEERIINLEFQDAQGKPLKSNGSMSSNEFRRIDLSQPPPPDTQLVIQLATPESVTSVPFEIQNIPLP